MCDFISQNPESQDINLTIFICFQWNCLQCECNTHCYSPVTTHMHVTASHPQITVAFAWLWGHIAACRIDPTAHNSWSTIFCNTLNKLFVFIWALKISFNIVNTVLNKLHTIYEKDKQQQLLTNFKPVHTLYSSMVLMCSLPSYLMWDSLGKTCCAHCSCSCQNCSYLCRSVVSLHVL